jgi:hypothetical protein
MNTTPIAGSIKQTFLPALLAIDTAVTDASQAQQELKLTLERLAAEVQVLNGLLQAPPPLEAALVKSVILRKRIDNMRRKIARVQVNLKR